MDDQASRLSRTIAYALRHRPQEFGLALDASGWVTTDQLIAALSRHDQEWLGLTQDQIATVLAAQSKQRFELEDGRIRALYGHSLKDTIGMVPQAPPAILFHGTTHAALEKIRFEGLISMRRQYVHLSPDKDTASEVGRRRAKIPVILTVRARQAAAAGCSFYHRNSQVWLSDDIEPSFLDLP